MAIMIDREGDFQVQVLSVEVKMFDSGSVSLSVYARILAIWQDAEEPYWEDWTQFSEMEVYGNFFVVKKYGTLNVGEVAALVSAIGWDADFNSIPRRNVNGWPKCQMQVEKNVYKGETSYRGAWITPFGAPVGRSGGMDEAGLSELATRYGSSLRAIASTAQPPAQQPAQPAQPPAQAQQPQQPADLEQTAAAGAEPNYPPTLDEPPPGASQ